MNPFHLVSLLLLASFCLPALRRLMIREKDGPTVSASNGSHVLMQGLKFSGVMLVCLLLARCAYNVGTRERQIPGGYRLVSVPVFKNLTADVTAEVYFTNAFIREMERSKLGKVVDKRDAEVQILGAVESIKYIVTNSRQVLQSPPNVGPNAAAGNVVQNTEYRVIATTALKLQRISDERILWEGKFSGEHNYLAPTITINGINSADALYNQSARDQTIKSMADDIMVEAYERMTENF